MGLSAENLWRKIRKSDKRAFEILYKNHYARLCLYAYGFIPDEELVKEIVDDVFLKIWEKRETIDIKYGVKPYLYRCIHNSCMDHLGLKGGLKQNNRISISETIIELKGDDEDYILRNIALKHLEKDIDKVIEELPPKCREIFILSRFELLSYPEISEKLNISVNTVKTQMSRALDSLRLKLKKYL